MEFLLLGPPYTSERRTTFAKGHIYIYRNSSTPKE
jgi:hypothetical protein